MRVQDEKTMGKVIGWMYMLKGIPHVPHWNKSGVYVAPGGIEWYEGELLAAGAHKKTAFLWERHWLRDQTPRMMVK